MMQAPPTGVQFSALPRKGRFNDGEFPCYTSRFALMPRDVWRPVSMNRHVPLIYHQLDGMCTSNGAVMTEMVERSMRNRPTNPILCPEHLYYQHSEWGTGSTLGENLRKLIDVGVCDRDTISKHDGVIKWPPEWEDLATENRVLEWVDLDAKFDAVASSLQRGHPCLIGVRWPGGGGHAVCATELVQVGDAWRIRGPNSWGENWGEPPGYSPEERAWLTVHGRDELQGGFYTLTEGECSDFRTFGCWAIGTTT